MVVWARAANANSSFKADKNPSYPSKRTQHKGAAFERHSNRGREAYAGITEPHLAVPEDGKTDDRIRIESWRKTTWCHRVPSLMGKWPMTTALPSMHLTRLRIVGSWCVKAEGRKRDGLTKLRA